MKKYQKNLALALTLMFIPLFTLAQDSSFDPGNIISDSDLIDSKSMNLTEINNFLKTKAGFISNYYTTNAHGTEGKSAAEIIYDAANATYECDDRTLNRTLTEAEKTVRCHRVSTISPKVLIVLLQKEMSLIEDKTPKQSQLDWAAGYGCFDNLACNPYYKSFGKQINSAALQFKDYFENTQNYSYKPGFTYQFSNTGTGPSTVTIENKATAALYNYTPHVYNGNYNFWNIWHRYFPNVTKHYPEGSLLKTADSPVVWLIQGGQKKPFDNWSSLATRFDASKILTVNANALDAYEPGTIIRFPNYSIIETEDNDIYLLVGDKKRLIPNTAIFKAIGFNPEEVIPATAEELEQYTAGLPLNADINVASLSGKLMKDKNTAEVFYVIDETKAPVYNLLLSTKFNGHKISSVTTAALDKYETVDPILFNTGELIKSKASPNIYVVEGNSKRPFVSEKILNSLGYDIKKVITVSPQHLYYYDNGAPIK